MENLLQLQTWPEVWHMELEITAAWKIQEFEKTSVYVSSDCYIRVYSSYSVTSTEVFALLSGPTRLFGR